MDFIERIFGISPDGGTGSLEFALLLVPIAGLYLLYLFGARKHSKSAERP